MLSHGSAHIHDLDLIAGEHYEAIDGGGGVTWLSFPGIPDIPYLGMYGC